MRRLALAGCLLACADWRLPPTFPQQAAGRPVIHEQAVIGISAQGDLAAAELVDADGQDPVLALLAFGRAGEPTRTLLQAPAARAQAIAQQLRARGGEAVPLLAALVLAGWPEASAAAAGLGFQPREAATPVAGESEWRTTGAAGAGALPLSLRIREEDEPVRSTVLMLSDGAPDAEIRLAAMPLTGAPVRPSLWIEAGVAWMVGGSVRGGEPLHRTVGIRRASIARGEAQLHNLHGLADYAAADLDAARREFDRAIAADPAYVDTLYNAGSVAALTGRVEEAVAFLRRAAAIDPARVQVLGRNDADLASLRKRPDVRALLGLHRLPPEGIPPPP